MAGDVASIASLFWLAYAELIAPRKKARNSGIFILIGGTRGTQVWLGADVLDRNDFEGASISGVTEEVGSAENAERIYEWQLQIRSGQRDHNRKRRIR
jgi:hypothetical protein